MNHYETVFIMTPVLSDDQAKEAVSKYKKLIQELGGKIFHEENWGLKKLAYPIQKKSTGFYHLFQFQAPGAAIGTLEVEYKRDERLLRFLTVALDKHAIEYEERRRNKTKYKEVVEKKEKATVASN